MCFFSSSLFILFQLIYKIRYFVFIRNYHVIYPDVVVLYLNIHENVRNYTLRHQNTPRWLFYYFYMCLRCFFSFRHSSLEWCYFATAKPQQQQTLRVPFSVSRLLLRSVCKYFPFAKICAYYNFMFICTYIFILYCVFITILYTFRSHYFFTLLCCDHYVYLSRNFIHYNIRTTHWSKHHTLYTLVQMDFDFYLKICIYFLFRLNTHAKLFFFFFISLLAPVLS